MGGGGGSWLGYPPKKFLEKYSPLPEGYSLANSPPPLKVEKTVYSPPKIGQFFGLKKKKKKVLAHVCKKVFPMYEVCDVTT